MDATAAADRAYEHVKAAILTREYAGGRLLTEGEVATAVGVSRTPVREALLRLAGEGLLQLYPKRGALVLPVSAAEVADVLEARELVEVHAADRVLAAHHIADHADHDGRLAGLADQLRDRLAEMRTAADAGDPSAFSAADRAFHSALVAATRNELLTHFYDQLRDRQVRMGTALMADVPGRTTVAVDEHAAILAAVEAGDRRALRKAVLAHLATLAANVASR